MQTKIRKNRQFTTQTNRFSKAATILLEQLWLFDEKENRIKNTLEHITIDALNPEYLQTDGNSEGLAHVLGFKLDEVKEFEEKTGKRVVSKEDYDLLQNIKKGAANQDSDQFDRQIVHGDEEIKVDPENVEFEVKQFEPSKPPKNTDMSNPKPHPQPDPIFDQDNSVELKNIGEWGEIVARKYLTNKFSEPTYRIIWLNDQDSIGQGYDFVIKSGDDDVEYYEVKSKIKMNSKLFEMTKSQWHWANHLHCEQKGEMYKILLISGAGRELPSITEIVNPAKLIKSNEINIHSVKIKI
ncbi:DUF3883 domain-containing protein [bacterium]|nr:DUF3883 domain-containing protein [bacterium]